MRILILMVAIIVSVVCSGQTKTRNVIIVTLDGYRWQELYKGVDPKIAKQKNQDDPVTIHRFEGATREESREKLMPFFWQRIGTQGQLYGNRNLHNKVNCSNMILISYPGYSEMLVGFPDARVRSNDFKSNPNPTVLEFIHHKDEFNNRVAAFSTWGAFPYIFREEVSGFHINSANDKAIGDITPVEKELNAAMSTADAGRSDVQTFQYAREFLKRDHPRVLFIGLDETDKYAHRGEYGKYLQAAHRADSLLADLWRWCQSDPLYRDNTTLFITTDHGRGSSAGSWRSHSLIVPGSRQIWMAVIGPDTPGFGELTYKSKLYQKQVAATIAAFLGLRYAPHEKTGKVIQTMVAAPLADEAPVTATASTSKASDN